MDQEIADINNIIKKTGALSTNDLAKLINFNTKDKADPSFEYPEQLEKNICEKIADAIIQPGKIPGISKGEVKVSCSCFIHNKREI